MRPQRVAGAAAALALGGCTLVVSTTGLTGGAAPGGPEGGADARSETGSGVDSGLDGGLDSAVDAPIIGPFCESLSPKPTFCADFDKRALTDDFELVNVPAIDTTLSRSPGRSVVARVEASATDRYCSLRRSLGITPNAVRIAIQVYLDEYDDTRGVEIANLRMEKPGGTCSLTASVRGGVWTLDEYCEGPGSPDVNIVHDSTRPGARGRWTSVSFTADFATRKASLVIDGEAAWPEITLSPNMLKGPAALYAGVNYVQTGSSRVRLHIDDLVIDAQ